MGKSNGFLEIERQNFTEEAPLDRIKHFKEFHTALSKKDQCQQGARCMDCGVPFCQYGKTIGKMVSGCPLNNLIPEWNDLIFRDNYEQALIRLLKTNNFPEFTSRVCPALCEKACTCSLNGDSVTVRENEYGIIENGFEKGLIKPHIPSFRIGKRIAVIGSGPAGLATADTLNKRGYDVDVFEKDDRFGGLLMYGIPNMKIEKEIIERRISLMKEEGVHFYLNTAIETKKQAKDMLSKYDSIVLACGSRVPRDIVVEGRNAKNIMFAVDYLTDVTKSLLNSNFKDKEYFDVKDKNVLVIGGGDTGNDCVATAIRHGCKNVIQLEMMEELPTERQENNPWPEYPMIKKTDYGQQESIALFKKDPRIYQTTVSKFILNEKQEVVKAVIVSLERKNGKMEIIKGSEKEIDVDLVLIAAGFIGCETKITKAFGVELDERQTVKTDEDSHKTNVKKVYVAGDMRRGQSLVVWAIREGRDTAKEIDFDLMGYTTL